MTGKFEATVLSHSRTWSSVQSGLSKFQLRNGSVFTGLILVFSLLIFMLACCSVSNAQLAVQTDVSTNQNSPSSTVSSPVFSTSAANQLLLAFIATDDLSSPNTTVQSLAGAGLAWALVERTNGESGDAEIWRAFAPAVLKNVSVTATLSQSVVSSITVLSFTGVPTTGTNGSGAIGAVASSYADGGGPAATLVTTLNGSLILGVGNDWDNAIARTPFPGQSVVHQDLSPTQDTYWVQRLNSPIAAKGTSVTLGDSAPTTDRYNLSICEVLAGTSTLAASASSLNFGSVTDGTTATLPLTIKSTGTAPVAISSDSITGTGFSISSPTLPATLTPGQSMTLQVSFHPTVASAASGTLNISSNSSAGSTSKVSLSGTGVLSQLSMSANSLAFGNVDLKTTSTQTLTLTASGTAAVIIDSANLTGSGFSMTGTKLPVTLNSGQTATFQVSFDPSAAGSVTGSVSIASNSGSTALTSIINLSGTGVTPQLTVSAATLSYGNVVLNSTSTKTLTLTSSGTGPVTINSAALSGAEFKSSEATFPTTLNPGQSLSVQVSFDPTLTGAASGSINISSNSYTGSASSVSLSGTGVSPNPVLTLSSTSLNFGDDPVGTAATQSVSLTSSGNTAVTVSSATLTGTGFTFSGATFPVTLNPGIGVTVQVVFDPTAAATDSGTLTFKSNSTTGSTSVVNLNGTGTAPQHQVSLTWNAPSNSPVPVTEYNVYRTTGSSSSYQLMDSTNSTSYVDLTVQANTEYTYYVTSMDSAGMQSSPSNQVTVTIP